MNPNISIEKWDVIVALAREALGKRAAKLNDEDAVMLAVDRAPDLRGKAGVAFRKAMVKLSMETKFLENAYRPFDPADFKGTGISGCNFEP